MRAARVELRPLQPRVTASGQWRAADSIVVIESFAAHVETLRAHPGDRVTKGETIGTVITQESSAALRGAEILDRQASGSSERAEARRALALAEHGLVRVPIIASADGIVLRRSVEPGAQVVENAPLLTIVPHGSFVFEAHVARTDAAQLAPGQRATIRMTGGELVPATVQRLLPQAGESDQNLLVWLSPSRVPSGVLDRLGTAVIEVGPPRRAPAVPDSALVQDDLTGEIRIARVSGGVAIWTPVKLGVESDGWRELLAPAIPQGTPVLVSGLRGLPDSARVEITK
ncbi:MAG: efflux RND transporter periplasmic adaptor subunit [Bacteroidota bacterium]